MNLLVSLAAHGWHPAAPRMSGQPAFAGITPFAKAARKAEQGGVDAVSLGLPEPGGFHLDPLPLLASLMGVTKRLGLCGYWPCDAAEPFHVARVFATLDHMASGRTGWIAGVAGKEALGGRFQRPDMPTTDADVAARSAELIDVARQLWDSWEDRAFVVDQQSGTFVLSEHVHPIDHEGRFFTVRGPLNVPRPVQGQPVILCRDGDLAASAVSVEIVLAECPTMAEAKARRTFWRAEAGKARRTADSIRLVARVMPILASSEAEAKERADKLDGMMASKMPRFVGTPAAFAAWMQEWQAAEACDGFDLLPAVLEPDLGAIVDGVVPELRRLGLRPVGQGPMTLRERLGLGRALSRFAA